METIAKGTSETGLGGRKRIVVIISRPLKRGLL